MLLIKLVKPTHCVHKQPLQASRNNSHGDLSCLCISVCQYECTCVGERGRKRFSRGGSEGNYITK